MQNGCLASFRPAALTDAEIPVRTQVRAGSDGLSVNHSEVIEVRTAVRAGADGLTVNHSEVIDRAAGRQALA